MTTVTTTEAQRLAGLVGLLADPTRFASCPVLLDGRAWTGGAPAICAGVAERHQGHDHSARTDRRRHD